MDDKKVIAFLLKIIYEMNTSSTTVSYSNIIQIENLMCEYGSYDLQEDEFRY